MEKEEAKEVPSLRAPNSLTTSCVPLQKLLQHCNAEATISFGVMTFLRLYLNEYCGAGDERGDRAYRAPNRWFMAAALGLRCPAWTSGRASSRMAGEPSPGRWGFCSRFSWDRLDFYCSPNIFRVSVFVTGASSSDELRLGCALLWPLPAFFGKYEPNFFSCGRHVG